MALALFIGMGIGGSSAQKNAEEEATTPTQEAETTTPRAERKGTTPKPSPRPKPSGETRRFSGNGTKNLGNITIDQDSTLNWTHQGNFFGVIEASGKVAVSSQDSSGDTFMEEGEYRNVQVLGDGDWTITIEPQ